VEQYIPISSSNESPNLHVRTPTKLYKKKCPRTSIESPHLPATLNASPSSPILTYEYSPSTSSMIESFIDMPSPISTRERRINKTKPVLFPIKQSPKKRLENLIKKKYIYC